VYEPRRKGLEILVEHILTGRRQRGMRASVEGAVKGENDMPPGAVLVLAVFARGFDQPFVGLGSAVGEKNLTESRQQAELLRQQPSGLGIEKVGGMDQPSRLRGHRLYPFRV
jgi:hypothetical protein